MTEDKPTVEALRVAEDLAVEDLHHSAWSDAHPVQIDHYWSGEIAPVGRHAEARVLWSDEALHVRYVCNQVEPLVVGDYPQDKIKTMYLWDRDVCEIFIATDPNVVERYLEFEVAPTGEWLDVGIDWTSGERESDWEFNSQMTTAAQIETERVTMAMRIPWNSRLPQPSEGERWRTNLFRVVGKDPTRGYLSWQPTKTPQPFFHVPQAFGWLVFNR